MLFSAADLFLVPFSIMWAGFVVFWEFTAVASRAPVFFDLWGIPFILVGLYSTAGRFVFKRRRKLATVYGLTDSRAIVLSGERSVADAPVKGMPMRIRRSRDGRHVNVIFGGGARWLAYQNTGLDFFGFGQDQGLAFFDVADPDGLIRVLDSVR
ncbi:hypothetical protein [Sinomonas sp. ASV322]|uniref:hypothetical protein n=1 Tax=Sinomonas sp. ASV322 TaxID=3041920 RepID=UPI0027DBF7F5|nr:hypothetical protein [Sinomonas sp. ASV322]MDQ4501625.1 hypothetical protein [Sinomonas sp. ASV322]